MRFLDTNILLYSIDEDRYPEKFGIARDILQRGDWAVSVQVLQEFYTQATRLTRKECLSVEAASHLVKDYSRFPVQPLTLDIVRAAIATHQRYQISYWDAAIIEAARTLGCHTVLSEDLNSGQDFGSVRVINPFVQPSH